MGESLRGQVYEALLHLGQGFLDYSRNELQPDPATLKAIYDNALILLYRLLFVFYAEARELLPVTECPRYRDEYSLHAIKREVAKKLSLGKSLLSNTGTLWPRLTALFEIINLGSPPLKVATFNGGLFDPERHPFLERNVVGDAHLMQAIDMLARVGQEFVDYRDLAERHLGTIYEGLLEFQLQPLSAEQPVDLASAREGWSVKLVTDKGDRKSSGSYYTPGFITRFMVEQAIGPVIDAALEKSAPQGAEAQRQAVLNVNVLDCSMGSGHFLVEAVEYIARRLVEADLSSDLRSSEADFDELAYWKRRVAQSCVYGVDLNPLAVDLAKLSLWLVTAAKDRPLSFLDHHLRPGNALVGARLDELTSTVNPAPRKLSKTAAKNTAKKEAAGQLTWATDSAFTQSMSQAVGSMWLIEENAAVTVADVKSQEKLYEQVREAFTRKYSRLADLVTATRFGLQVDPALWGPLADFAMGRTLAPLPQFKKWLDEADALAGGHRFFHWELEFPEVFFDRFGRPLGDEAGFDVVIGNPPYVRQERLQPLKPYFQTSFASFHGVADLYLYFFEQGLKLLQDRGRLAYVSSGTFARANFAIAFRRWLPTMGQIETLIDFGENQPFEGAEMVRPSILVLTRERQTASFRSLLINEQVPDSLELAVQSLGIRCAPESLDQPEWSFQQAATTRLFLKLQSRSSPLCQIVNGKMYRGVVTGANDVFFIDSNTRDRLIKEDPSAESIIKPMIRGEDLRPWYQEREGHWLIFTRRGINIESFPSVKRYLESYRARLEPRPADFPDNHEWTGRKPGTYKWYEIQDSIDYHEQFEHTKLFWPNISKLPRFSWDDQRLFVNDPGFIIPDATPALLGILQSRPIWFAVTQICQPLRLRAGLWQYRLFIQFISRLPIPPMSNEASTKIGSLAIQITSCAQTRYDIHCKTRHQIQRDLGTPEKKLNQKLTTWWDLDFVAFRTEIQKVYKRDIPVKERAEWDEWLTEQRAEHRRLTDEIIALETELNDRVYRLFDLTADEIKLIEETTKYPYGEV